MPRTVAPSMATRIVLNRVSHLSLATIPVMSVGPAAATSGTLLGGGGNQRKVLPHLRPATHNTDDSVLVGPVDADEVVDLVVGVDRLAGVAPEALGDVVLHRPALDVPVVDVGDLQLAARGGLERRQELPDRLVVEVEARHGVRAGRRGRLLDDALHAVAVQLG